MANLTKKAIMDSFVSLLSQKPLDKITVKDIVEDCDVTRRTFYYHFQDIYALVEDIFLTETELVVSEYSDSLAWSDGFIAAGRFVLENRQAVYHLYNSVHRDEVEKYIKKIADGVMRGFVDRVSEGIDACADDKRLIGEFYIDALVGLLKSWLDEGMKTDPEQVVRRIEMLFEGNIKASLLRSEEALHKKRDM